jgi:hypothetical protein
MASIEEIANRQLREAMDPEAKLDLTMLLPEPPQWSKHVGPPPIERQMGDFVEVTPQRIVSMCTAGDRTFVATERFVYELLPDGKWYPMVFMA